MSSSDAVVKHLRAYFANEADREKLVITYLNLSNALIGTEVLFTGTLSTSAVYPREVVKRVIKYHAAAIIIAHNHPSGNPEPSKDDKEITEKINHLEFGVLNEGIFILHILEICLFGLSPVIYFNPFIFESFLSP